METQNEELEDMEPSTWDEDSEDEINWDSFAGEEDEEDVEEQEESDNGWDDEDETEEGWDDEVEEEEEADEWDEELEESDEDKLKEVSEEVEENEFRSSVSAAETGTAVKEDKVLSSAMDLSSDSFALRHGFINFGDLAFSEPLKRARKDTCAGLTQSVKELGILTPLHVMITEGYADWLAEDEETRGQVYTGFKYLLVDGFRRVFAGLKNGLESAPAVIWEFKDKEFGADIAVSLSLLLNKAQRRSWVEVWGLFQILELQFSMTPSTLEFLLGLDGGDAMKLKDVMLCEYDDVKQDLIEKKKNLQQAYNQLQKYRKEEDTISAEDRKGISEIEEAEEMVGDRGKGDLSDSDVKELLEMAEGELEEDNFGGADPFGYDKPEVQNVKERHPLDPALRSAVLRRDDFTCQISGFGRGITSNVHLGVLEVHHILPVYLGGNDGIDNLVTLSSAMHSLVHLLSDTNCKIGMSKEEFESLPEEDQELWKKAIKYARVIVKGEEIKGYKRNKETVKQIKHKKDPFWVTREKNKEALETDYSGRENIE